MRANRIRVHRNLNEITIYDLSHPKITSQFLSAIRYGIQAGFTEFKLNFRNIQSKSIFPNAATPISGMINYYSTEKDISFILLEGQDLDDFIHIINPLQVSFNNEILKHNCLNKVWKFSDSDEVFEIVNAYLEELEKTDRFEEGVVASLEWSLNEVMDNVIQHSDIALGFIMGQIHQTKKHVAFCIYDYGRGIFNSLKNSNYSPDNPSNAITLSIKEGVTRDKNIGQGNGMYGLYRLVDQNEGILNITSGGASYMMQSGKVNHFDRIPYISKKNGATSIDFQLDYDKNISLSDALKFRGMSYENINFRVEKMEDDFEQIIYNISEKSGGYGTRKAGEKCRNAIINLYVESKKIIVIDFAGVGMISSSFADELIGKLVVEFGFFGFNNIIKLKGMNEHIQKITDRSVSQRMFTTFSSSM